VLQLALSGREGRNKTFLAAYHLMRVIMNWIDPVLAVLMIVPVEAGTRAGFSEMIAGSAATIRGRP
jgi:hypothetical protein